MHEYLSDPAAGLLLLGNRFTELLFGDQAAAGELLTEAGAGSPGRARRGRLP